MNYAGQEGYPKHHCGLQSGIYTIISKARLSWVPGPGVGELLTSTSMHRRLPQLISPKHLEAEQSHGETNVVKVQSGHRGLPWLGPRVYACSFTLSNSWLSWGLFSGVHSSFFSCKDSDRYLLPKNKTPITFISIISLILCLHI